MSRRGLYIYGLIHAGTLPPLSQVGLPDGDTPGLVQELAAGAAAAVVSPFATDRRPAPLRRNLEPHDRVIQEIAKTAAILPLAFGHVARGPREVRALLAENAHEIEAELDRLGGMVEMGVKLRWDMESLFGHLVETDPVLAQQRDRIFHPSRPATYAEKLELGRLFDERLRARKSRLVDQLVQALSETAVEVDVGEARGENDIADLGFLVPRARSAAFAQQVSETAARWPPEYVFQCTGPWAPARFVQLNLHGATPAHDALGGA